LRLGRSRCCAFASAVRFIFIRYCASLLTISIRRALFVCCLFARAARCRERRAGRVAPQNHSAVAAADLSRKFCEDSMDIGLPAVSSSRLSCGKVGKA
jgi:hypothetical protein